MTVSTPEQQQLPHLWQKPAYITLLTYLKSLRLEPPVWNLKATRSEILKQQRHQHVVDRRETISFLSVIIKNSLSWLDDDSQREEIWEEASRRLSERCGRTAMGEMIRRWPFDHPDHHHPPFELVIREPPLTGDSLGLKTWGSSYVLAQLLLHQFASPLSHLINPGPKTSSRRPATRVLELGSGTGLLGLAAASVWSPNAAVTLTDLPDILPNLSHNASLNHSAISARGGASVSVAALTWGSYDGSDTDPRFTVPHQYPLVLAADPLYDDDHPALLASTIDAQLSLGQEARALVMVPHRDEITKNLLTVFRNELTQRISSPLVCVEEDVVPGQDDWGDDDDDDEGRGVDFWWGIFRRRGVEYGK